MPDGPSHQDRPPGLPKESSSSTPDNSAFKNLAQEEPAVPADATQPILPPEEDVHDETRQFRKKEPVTDTGLTLPNQLDTKGLEDFRQRGLQAQDGAAMESANKALDARRHLKKLAEEVKKRNPPTSE